MMKALSVLGHRISHGNPVTLLAPEVVHPEWGHAGNGWTASDPVEKGSMLVLDFGGDFGVTSPSREEVLASFGTGSAALDGAGMSGATMVLSGDRRLVAKKIVKIEVRYAHKITRNLKGVEAHLLTPIYYLFQRCHRRRSSTSPTAFAHLDSDRPELKDLWRDCEAWMVTPYLDISHGAGGPSQSFDLKGDHLFPGTGIPGEPFGPAEGDKYRRSFPSGLSLSDNDLMDLQTRLQATTQLLVALEVFDYSLLVKVKSREPNSQETCEGSDAAGAYQVSAPAAGLENATGASQDFCMVVSVIDYLGHPAQKALRMSGRHRLTSFVTSKLFRKSLAKSVSAQYAEEFMTSAASQPGDCHTPTYFHPNCTA